MDSWGVFLYRIFLFLNLYIPPWLQISFKFIVLRLLANTFCESKNLISSFLLMPPSKLTPRFLSLPPSRKEITHSSWTVFSEDLFFSQQKGGERIMELKKLPRLNLRGYWSQVLINSTIFATFALLVSVLVCHNLASSMQKCEGSLT